MSSKKYYFNKQNLILITTILLLTAFAALGLNALYTNGTKELKTFSMPGLPRPIAREDIIITSAGQSTDAFIIRDMANQLMLHNYFMPQVTGEDLSSENTLVLVVGYSSVGLKLHNTSYKNELDRLTKLLEAAKNKESIVITIYIGGKERRGQKTDELLKLVSPYTDYFIGTRDANFDNFIGELVGESKMTVTLVKNINNISSPFASAFR